MLACLVTPTTMIFLGEERLRGQCIEKQQDRLLDFGPMAIPRDAIQG